MPHLSLEYTQNLVDYDAPQALRILGQVMFDSGLFGEADIKSRAYRLDDHLVGTGDTGTAFLHVQVSLLCGRTDAQKQALGARIAAALKSTLPAVNGPVQLTVDVRDMNRDCYAKEVLPG
ncbi:5-carboxymethyl-2-hydroxymuconate Delta-isomerase [Jeongeupia naejangsanensis]|uniref:5-carboxymethyl-2-hydroxymuconate Delta-isomerase n=1 Tax=Jeongeupia naejangsanensis TaxID=613195 RepID=A0ABS2BLZ4_9NEIS|nr:5-carboxymethyl-2-hydroxymuconate Delta-isomerase [Jeongeupia naejangsanensis]MBM3116639.1 5-carboxymethyl-2-hydroxymuconate Delta-isomerase [Jeongeupia naejangsanensis]